MNLKNIPINRSSFHFIKLFRDFKGKNINELNVNFRHTKEIIDEIYKYENSKD